jgi:hypothetical protein
MQRRFIVIILCKPKCEQKMRFSEEYANKTSKIEDRNTKTGAKQKSVAYQCNVCSKTKSHECANHRNTLGRIIHSRNYMQERSTFVIQCQQSLFVCFNCAHQQLQINRYQHMQGFVNHCKCKQIQETFGEMFFLCCARLKKFLLRAD